MMNYILYLLLFAALLVVAAQDFKERAIWWGLIPIILGLGVGISALQVGFSLCMTYFGVNLLFLAVQFGIAVGYFSLKNGQLVNIADRYVGWGDILFFIAICCLFSPINFIITYTAGLFLVLLFIVGLQFYFKQKIDEIPLAGGLALLLVGCLIVDLATDWNRYHEFSFFMIE